MKSIFHKIHSSGTNFVLAVCDRELLGKTLKRGELEFKVSESFYGNKGITEAKLKKLLHEFGNINLVGKKSVGIALKERLLSEKNIIDISGVPHAQIFQF
ncbi:MAG TPA: DUF424 family protein [archaeon]|nr:DUF424 family protein [archaeon]